MNNIHGKAINSFDFDFKTRLLFTCCADNSVKIFKVDNFGKEIMLHYFKNVHEDDI